MIILAEGLCQTPSSVFSSTLETGKRSRVISGLFVSEGSQGFGMVVSTVKSDKLCSPSLTSLFFENLSPMCHWKAGFPLLQFSLSMHLVTGVEAVSYQSAEMRAARLALLAIDPSLYVVILAVIDKTTVVAYINYQGGTRSDFPWQETKLLFQLIMAKRLTLTARDIAEKLNVIADQLAGVGQIIPTEWSFHPSFVQCIFHK